MAVTGAIPLPGSGMEGFNKGFNTIGNMLQQIAQQQAAREQTKRLNELAPFQKQLMQGQAQHYKTEAENNPLAQLLMKARTEQASANAKKAEYEANPELQLDLIKKLNEYAKSTGGEEGSAENGNNFIQQIAGGLIKKKTGINPYEKTKEQLENIKQKNHVELEGIKNDFKKQQKADELKMSDEKERHKTIRAAEQDLPHLEDTLESLEELYEIADKDPSLFGHQVRGAENFANWTKNSNAGRFQTLMNDKILQLSKQLSSKGSVAALDYAIKNKANFGESQETAKSKLKASIEMIQRAIRHADELSGKGNKITVIDNNGNEFTTTKEHAAKYMPKDWKIKND